MGLPEFGPHSRSRARHPLIGRLQSFPQIFAQGQLYAASLINSSNLITFDQIVTDLLGTV
jgi:hypothetical protein